MNTVALNKLKIKVFDGNMKLAKSGLITSTFGNVSGIDREAGLVAIKPSGISYGKMKPEDIVMVSMEGKKLDNNSPHPSSDTPTHLELYRNFVSIGRVTHSHSIYDTSFSQAKIAIPCLGTTHADYFNGAIPITDVIEDKHISGNYELDTGKLIVETFKNIDPMKLKACLVACHGPFTWGRDADDSVQAAIILEYIAVLAYRSLTLNRSLDNIKKSLLDKHYLRKHDF